MSLSNVVIKLGQIIPSYSYDADLRTIETEDEIYTTAEREGLSEEETQTLINLFEDKVDLNEMDEDSCYELPETTPETCHQLINLREELKKKNKPLTLEAARKAKVLTIKQIAQMIPFIEPFEETTKEYRFRLKLRTVDEFQDENNPAAYFNASGRIKQWNLAGGLILFAHDQYASLSYDPKTQKSYTEGSSPQLEFSKGYLYWDTNNFSVIGGSYTVGFGQGRVFDNSGKTNPLGWYKDSAVFQKSDGTDYYSYRGLFGAAARLEKLEIGGNHLIDSTLFYSIWTYDYNQDDFQGEEVWDEEREGKISRETIPDVFREQIVGGNATFFWNRRIHMGVTGYRGDTAWMIADPDLKFAPSSKYPERNIFAAIGSDFALGFDNYDFYGEYAATDGGGHAFYTRGEANFLDKALQLELSYRYYSPFFDNPHSRGKAALDQYQGHIDADETGGMLRFTYYPLNELRLRGSYNQWMHPTIGIYDLETSLRADYYIKFLQLKIGSWFKYHNNDLSKNGAGVPYDEGGELYGANGSLTYYSHLWPHKKIHLGLEYRRYFEGAKVYPDAYQQNHSFYFFAQGETVWDLRLSLRVKLYDEDLSDLGRGERSWWNYLELYKPFRDARFKISLRGDMYTYVDSRESTYARENNPIYRVRGFLEYSY